MIEEQKEVERLEGKKINWKHATDPELFVLLDLMMKKGPYL